MCIQRQLPFDIQIKHTKETIARLMKTFRDDKFTVDDIKLHKHFRYKLTDGGMDVLKVLDYLVGLGEIKILNYRTSEGEIITFREEHSFINEFKVTEKFGKIPNMNLDIPAPTHLYSEADVKKMSEDYALFAGFENNLRFFIADILKENKGLDWWENNVPEGIIKSVRIKKNDTSRRWHIEEPKNNIQFTDFKELVGIITYYKNWKGLFEDIFDDQEIIRSYLKQLETPRNTIAHSNILSKEMKKDMEFHIKKINDLLDQYRSK